MTDPSTDEYTLLGLLADIRAAAGDREGRLMQPELVEHIRGLKANADGAALLGQASAQVMIERDRLRADKRALLQGSQEQASEISRLRAEVEAKDARIAELEQNLAMMGGHNAYREEKIAELEAEVNRWREIQTAVAQLEGAGPEWPDHGNAPLAITAGYALHKMQADRLRAEVEALHNRCQQAHDAILSGEDDAEVMARLDFWSARKGEGSEG